MVKDFICNRARVEHVAPGNLDSEFELMSIRRDLLLRTALLRLPDLAEMRASMPSAPAPSTPAPKRRAVTLRPGRRVASVPAQSLPRAD